MNYYLKGKYDLYEAKSNGTMVSIIKELRNFTGYPLKEAKKVFDEICSHGYFEIPEDEYNRLLYQYDRYKYSQNPSFYVEKHEEENTLVKRMLISAVYELVKEEQFERAIQTLELLQNFKEGK